MQTVVEMTTFLDPRAMEAELDYLAPALAKKSGETPPTLMHKAQSIKQYSDYPRAKRWAVYFILYTSYFTLYACAQPSSLAQSVGFQAERQVAQLQPYTV